MTAGGVIIVSNRLPITVSERAGQMIIQRAIGGVATTLDAIARRYSARWVGSSGLPRVLSDDELATVQFPHGLIPVQADAELLKGYYDHFANRLLWPSLHGIFTKFRPSTRDWQAFSEMSRRFAEVIATTIRSADEILWVHDYHLMLVPGYLRDMGIKNRIGFFLHTPFAAPKVMLGLPHIHELLAGLCAADVLGFQTERDVDNFWQCMRVVGGNSRPGLVGVFPIGAHFEAYKIAATRPSVQQLVAKRREETHGKRVIFSLSRLDYTKGIVPQLLAIEQFMAAYPKREELLYKLVVAPSREQIDEYRTLKTTVDRVAHDVIARLGTPNWRPIDYSYENLGFEDVVSWYKTADTLLLMPEMDGMNLIAKEYVAARHDDGGAIILSNAAGAASQLQEALLVNPGDTDAAATALYHAHTMPEAERLGRWHSLRTNVREQDAYWWAEQFLSTLEGKL
jgi:trehalose 6-phosphate synthase/phosphatase